MIVEMAARAGLVGNESGVFLVYADPPFDTARVCQVTDRAIGVGRDFTADGLIRWLGMASVRQGADR